MQSYPKVKSWDYLVNSVMPSILVYLQVRGWEWGAVVSGMAASRSLGDILRTMSASPSSAFLGAGFISGELFPPGAPQQLQAQSIPNSLAIPVERAHGPAWVTCLSLDQLECSVGQAWVT